LQEAAFDANATNAMAAAYEAALAFLGLKNRTDPLTELIAHKVIEVYRSGVHDPAQICDTALRELDVPIRG
jgi:hypothetical protein